MKISPELLEKILSKQAAKSHAELAKVDEELGRLDDRKKRLTRLCELLDHPEEAVLELLLDVDVPLELLGLEGPTVVESVRPIPEPKKLEAPAPSTISAH